MKGLLYFIIAFLFYQPLFCQYQLNHKVLYSSILKDSIKYDVWLPNDWSEHKKYPAIYLNSYAVLGSGNSMLVAAHLNNFLNRFPSSVVVDIVSGTIQNMDYDYTTGKVDKRGLKFISCLQEELIPKVEKEYKTSRFRTFIGQSYSSSYANYLFLNNPGLFNAFILLTPEKIGKDQPPFKIDNDVKTYYNTHQTFYYLAAGGKDMKRRRDYTLEIAEKIKALDSTNFHFENQSFAEADHNNILNYALLPGLNFIYSASTYSIPDGKMSIMQWLDSINNNRKTIYGIDPVKNSSLQVEFHYWLYKNGNKEDLNVLAKYFEDTTANDNYIMLSNTAYAYRKLEDFRMAEEYYKKSINEGKRRNNPLEAYLGYINLSRNVYWKHDKNIDAAWYTLLNALKDTNENGILYYLGELSIAENYKLDEGITYLLDFVSKGGSKINPSLNLSNGYLLLAKAYYQKKEIRTAKNYLKKSLKENPNNSETVAWQKMVKL